MASIHRLRTRTERLRLDQGDLIRDFILATPDIPNRAAGEIIAAIDRQTAASNGWTFLMISPTQNAAVVEWLATHSARPKVALQVWAQIFTAVRSDTNEVMLTRDELARRVGAAPNAITDALRELESIKAISRTRERLPGVRGLGRLVLYLNPHAATHLTGRARDLAQEATRPVETTDWAGRKHAIGHAVVKLR